MYNKVINKSRVVVFLIVVIFLSVNEISAQTMNLVFSFTSNLTTIELPLFGTVDVTVDWGDGSATEDFTTAGFKNHTYTTTGTINVSISGSLTTFGEYYYGWIGADKLIEVTDFGNLGLKSLKGAFKNADNLTSVPASLPSTITDLSYLFLNNDQATVINLDSWDVSSVTDMSSMFMNAVNFNQNISDWDVSSVTDMLYMFRNAKAFNQNICDWNVSSVQNMAGMFSYASAFNQNLGNWDIGAVTDMSYMFDNANLTSNYDSLLIGWESQIVQYGVSFHGGNSYYSDGVAAKARKSLIEDEGWIITDMGMTIATVITTQAVSYITSTTATGNGNIIETGAPKPTAHGMCWNKTGTPTVAEDNATNEGQIYLSGSFVSEITNLTPNTTYYARAYAINDFDTTYGGEVIFTTLLTTPCNNSFIYAGDKTSNGIEIYPIIGEGVLDRLDPDYIWYIDIENDGVTDLQIRKYGYSTNNADIYTMINILNENTQIAHSISYEEYISSAIPVIDTTISVNNSGDTIFFQIAEFSPAFMLDNWIHAFNFNNRINDDYNWISEDCMLDVYFKRDAAANSWSFSSINPGQYIGFRKIYENDTLYGWIDANYSQFAFRNIVQDSEVAICGNHYVFGTQILTESGIYIENFISEQGCDSIVRLNLSILENTIGTDIQTACERFTWIDGNTYTESNNTATHTLTNTVGCDSIITLNLTLNYDTYSNITETSADSYILPSGIMITESGVYTDTIANSVGCDSIISIELSIITNTNEIKTGDLLTFFPNPVSNEFNVVFKETFTGQINVYNLSGKILLNEIIEEKKDIRLPIGHFDKGMYIVKVKSDKLINCFKIIIE